MAKPSLVHNGECFSYLDPMNQKVHYFQQREEHVLHFIPWELINQLDRDYIRQTPDLHSISREAFADEIRATIFALELNEFWKP